MTLIGSTLLLQVLLMIGGLVALYFGAESLVRGSSAIGFRLGLTPVVIGLTIVAYGTSTPELFVGVAGALDGQGDIVIGNIVGANILNIALMLGVAALIRPQEVRLQLIRWDLPIVIFAYIAFLWAILNGIIGRFEGAFFFAGIVAYTVFNIVHARNETRREVQKEFEEGLPQPSGNTVQEVGFIILGFFLLAMGSDLLVNNAVAFSDEIGISKAVVALTVVAIGTTSPELATAVVAASRGESDIVFGNSFGSCLYNVLCVLGVAAIISPIVAPNISLVDIGVMIFLAVIVLPMMRTGYVLRRWEGALLIMIYCIYLAYLWPK
ncbi:MAG: calcium/sodium antiporter [Verrucomicrobiota bacterium]